MMFEETKENTIFELLYYLTKTKKISRIQWAGNGLRMQDSIAIKRAHILENPRSNRSEEDLNPYGSKIWKQML